VSDGIALAPVQLTDYHAKYYAHELTRRHSSGMDRLSMSLFDATVDLNPHQIEAALFALASPLSKGVILADEVGLGKTIEAGIVLCQFWAERKRRLLVLCPASLRKQWALELEEKFSLPVLVLDAKAYHDAQRAGRGSPLDTRAVIIIMSFNYANRLREELKAFTWDLAVIDEAHKLRNAYRPTNKVGQGLRWATEDCRKLLLTATPLQNSLVELYGLSTLIDEHLFGDINSFRSQYASAGSNITELRQRLSTFCKRTLRNEVTEYIRYTERRTITRPFEPTDDEHALYDAVSAFLQRPDSYALPQRQRHLTALILRKLLASSSLAIAATLDTLKVRLEALRDDQARSDPEFTERLIEGEEIEDKIADRNREAQARDLTRVVHMHPALQQLKARMAIVVRRDDFAVKNKSFVGDRIQREHDLRIAPGNVGSAARVEMGAGAVTKRKRAHPVVLKFEQPAGTIESFAAELGQHQGKIGAFQRTREFRDLRARELADNLLAHRRRIAHLFDRQPRQHRTGMLLEDVGCLGVFVALFDQQPVLLVLRVGASPSSGPHQRECSAEFEAVERDIHFAVAY